MNISDKKEKIFAAHKLLTEETTSFEKFEQIRTLIRGFNPKVDKLLAEAQKAANTLKNLRESDIIQLSAENLPENTEEEKKRKKALLWFINSIKELKNEVERIKKELEQQERGEQTGAETTAQIAAAAKGPFGLLTIAAIIAVGGFILVKGKTSQSQPAIAPTPTVVATATPTPIPTPTPSPQTSPSPKAKIKVINYNVKQIPLDQLEVRTGPDCTNSPQEAPHYHAKNNQYVRATDGTVIQDPGGCAFGRQSEVQVVEIEVPSHTNPSLF